MRFKAAGCINNLKSGFIKRSKKCFFFSFWKRFSAYCIYKKKSKKEERKVMLKNTKSNSKSDITKLVAGYDRIENLAVASS